MALHGCGSILGVAARTVAGYEYHYRFSVDDEIAQFYQFQIYLGKKTYLFEIRTNFIIKPIDDGGDQFVDSERFDGRVYGGCDEFAPLMLMVEYRLADQIVDSERFDGRVCGDCDEYALMLMVEYRLAEYWMTKHEIVRLVHEACGFATGTATDPKNAHRSLIPVVVHLDVCTVQQENETVDSVNDRAITAEKLVPFYVWPRATGVDGEKSDSFLASFLLDLVMARAKAGDVVDHRCGIRPRVRVENIEEGMTIMPLCDICLRGPMIGNYISVLPSCNHAFHTHCIVRRLLLENNYFCPTCQVRAYPYIHDPSLICKFIQFYATV